MARRLKPASDFSNMMTKEQATYMFKVDQRTISRWQNQEDDPFPQPYVDGAIAYYDMRDVMLWKVRREVGKLTVGSDGEIIDYEKERARLTRAQADTTEMNVKKMKKELIPIDLLTFALNDVANQVSSILGSIVMKLKNRCPELTATQIEIVKREIVKAQNAATKALPDMSRYE